MPRTYKLEGIVIKRLNIGEADKLLTIFCRNYGKIVVIAKGIRKINSRKAPHLELLNHITAYCACGKNIDLVIEAQTESIYKNIRNNIDKLANAYQIIEIADRLCPEKEEHDVIYQNILKSLAVINCSEEDTKDETTLFSLCILRELGYLPKDQILTGKELRRFLEDVMEKKLKSDVFLANKQPIF